MSNSAVFSGVFSVSVSLTSSTARIWCISPGMRPNSWKSSVTSTHAPGVKRNTESRLVRTTVSTLPVALMAVTRVAWTPRCATI